MESKPTSDPQGWLRQAASFDERGTDDIVETINERLDMEIKLCDRNIEHLQSEIIKCLREQEREQALRAELLWNERKRDAIRAGRDAAIAEVTR